MLTKNDLDQIRSVVSQEIQKETKPLKTDISDLKMDVKTLKKDVRRIQKDQKTIVNFFDSDYLELRGRILRVEAHLDLEPQV